VNTYDCDYCHGDLHHLVPYPLRLIPGLKTKNAQGTARGISKEVQKDPMLDLTEIIKEKPGQSHQSDHQGEARN
jgi:hypothetical protein